MYGYYDPFLFGPGYSDIDSYTVYTSGLTMKIDRVSDRKRLFEGTAQAQSLSNNLTYLVPNLIEAMFTNFPGQRSEEHTSELQSLMRTSYAVFCLKKKKQQKKQIKIKNTYK